MKYYVFTCFRQSTKTFIQVGMQIKFKSDLLTFFECFKQELPQFQNHEFFEVTPEVYQLVASNDAEMFAG